MTLTRSYQLFPPQHRLNYMRRVCLVSDFSRLAAQQAQPPAA